MGAATTRYSTGFFSVDTGTAAIDVRLSIFLENFESEPASVAVSVSRLADGEVVVLAEGEVTVPGGERQVIDIDPVEGEDLQVTVTLPTQEYPLQSQIVPSVAVISAFQGEDEESTLLHWLSAGDFVPVDRAQLLR